MRHTDISGPVTPLLYNPSYEVIEKHEVETTQKLVEAIARIGDATFEDQNDAIRSAHAKGHAVVQGTLEVKSDIPDIYRHDIFAKNGTWPVVMRLSTAPGDPLDDNVSTSRGLAIKVIGVNGDRLPGSEMADTQDFLLVNGPNFLVSSARNFLRAFAGLSFTAAKGERLKVLASTLLRPVEVMLEKLGKVSPMTRNSGGQPETNPLGDSYFTQAPILYGPYMAKVSLAPSSVELRALTDCRIDLKNRPDGLREIVSEHFAAYDSVWDVRVQLCTDVEAMPLEDPHKIWPEDQSPYVTVATVTIPRQAGWDDAAEELEHRLHFSPWQGIAAHRPLGAVMRVRKETYEFARALRGARQGQPIVEPQVAALAKTGGCPLHR